MKLLPMNMTNVLTSGSKNEAFRVHEALEKQYLRFPYFRIVDGGMQ